VIAEWQGCLLTFPVHEVHGIHRYNPEELLDSPGYRRISQHNVHSRDAQVAR